MTDDAVVRAITVDLAHNRLTLHLNAGDRVHPGGPTPPVTRSPIATLDMGTGGRLLGVEVEGRYFVVSELTPADLALARGVAAPVTLRLAPDGSPAAVEIPRRGDGYEITYPSGNR